MNGATPDGEHVTLENRIRRLEKVIDRTIPNVIEALALITELNTNLLKRIEILENATDIQS